MSTAGEQQAIRLMQDEAIVLNGTAQFDAKSVDLRVRRGEVVALVGPNGSGKTSVTQVLVGELPASGPARVAGLDPVADAADLKGRIGFLIRDLETMGSLSSRDVLEICAAVRDCAMDFGLELAERLELDLDRPMSELSQGQLRRLGLVQAFMHRPEIVVLDDPMTVLDEHGRQTLAAVLREVAAAGAAVLITAQTEAETAAYADRIVTFTDRATEVADEVRIATPDSSTPATTEDLAQVVASRPGSGFVESWSRRLPPENCRTARRSTDRPAPQCSYGVPPRPVTREQRPIAGRRVIPARLCGRRRGRSP